MNELFGKIFVKSESRKIPLGTLRLGTQIKIRAKFRKSGDKLNIDLLSDKKSSTLSMSISTGQQIIVKEVFEATIKVCDDYYEVLVNDKNVFNITHQKNTQNIQKIVTSGCKIYLIEVVQDNKPFQIPDIIISDLSEPKEKPADDDAEVEANAEEDDDVQSPDADENVDSFDNESVNSFQSFRFNESLMKCGDVITLEAKVLNENERCNINFLGSGDSVILQISINHQESEIICNDYTLENGWGIAEKFNGFPVSSTEIFQIIVTVHESHFELQINGQHLCNFQHRQPFSEVKNIVPKGALFCSVQTVEAETVEESEEITDTQNDSEVLDLQETDNNNNNHESPNDDQEPSTEAEDELEAEAVEEELVEVVPPLIKKIQKSDLKSGFFITIKGRIPGDKNKSMIISLQESEQKKIFHITIDLENNQIIRNDATPEKGLRNKETWGQNPISCDKNFKLKIIFHPQQYELQIDNKHFCSFHQRMPISLIKDLVIIGGTVFSVNFGNTRDIVSCYSGSRRGSQNSVCSASFTFSKKSIEL